MLAEARAAAGDGNGPPRKWPVAGMSCGQGWGERCILHHRDGAGQLFPGAVGVSQSSGLYRVPGVTSTWAL